MLRTISIGKFGSFQANHILGRPYHLTFEIADVPVNGSASILRVVPAAELHAQDIGDSITSAPETEGQAIIVDGKDGVQFEVGADGKVVMRSNRQTIDDPSSQRLTAEEIELLKQQETGSGRDVIAKILESHSALDQKTAFALAKYTLRKTKKYLRRFSVSPVDVTALANYILTEKESGKIMEMREETLALLMSWSNVHYMPDVPQDKDLDAGVVGVGRWLVIDETAGLIVAAMAERMGILYAPDDQTGKVLPEDGTKISQAEDNAQSQPPIAPTKGHITHPLPMSARSNSITLVHSNTQPNVSLLKYFDFDPTATCPAHPLYTHLKTISWLQLLSPEEEISCAEPELLSEETLRQLKGNKRGAYYRKRRRWERIKSVVDETRAGGFDGLVIASYMKPASILHHLIPLLKGAAQVAIYSPNVEPLAELADYYSTSRRSAYLKNRPDAKDMPTEDFPLDPTLLLAPTIQTARVRPWQVLPGRTHPLMTGRGGSEGYVFTATRVLPIEGKVEARGKFKKRKVNGEKALDPNEAKAVKTQGTDEHGEREVDGREEDLEGTSKMQDERHSSKNDAVAGVNIAVSVAQGPFAANTGDGESSMDISGNAELGNAQS